MQLAGENAQRLAKGKHNAFRAPGAAVAMNNNAAAFRHFFSAENVQAVLDQFEFGPGMVTPRCDLPFSLRVFTLAVGWWCGSAG